jgi:hypothetical protein
MGEVKALLGGDDLTGNGLQVSAIASLHLVQDLWRALVRFKRGRLSQNLVVARRVVNSRQLREGLCQA